MSSDGGIRIKCSVDLHGLEEDLIRLGPKIAKRIFRKLLKVLGTLWVEQVKAHVPVDSGDLRESIAYAIKTSPKEDAATLTVGPSYDTKAAKKLANRTENPGIYGLFVEYGLKKRKYHFTPFMRPTFDSTADTMIQLFASGLREELEEAIKE